LKTYLETRHGSVLKHTTKVDKMGFEMRVHLFQMRKDELNDNRLVALYLYLGIMSFW